MSLAARGLRDLDTGTVPVTDETESTVLVAQARGVHMRSAVIAVALTAVTFLLP